MSYIAIDNGQDIIDSRDIIVRIEELEAEREALSDAVDEAEQTLADAKDETSALAGTEDEADAQTAVTDAKQALADWDDSDEATELKTLQGLAEDIPSPRDGVTLIRDSYFEEYAQQLADDIGAIDRNANWPCNCIDWERAASELQCDYSSVEYDNVTYWYNA